MNHSIHLSAGHLSLAISPSVGGSISTFTWADGANEWPILHNRNNGTENVLGMASFPLVPFVNRVRGGGFMFRGRDVRLQPNMAGDPSPIHGQGWLAPWTVESSDAHAAILSYRHEAGEWPWSYEARQQLNLDEQGLSYAITCRNLSDDPMPCGLGIHPYFPCGPQTRLDTEVEQVWTIDEHVLPVEKVPAEGRFSLRDRLICGQDLDHGFGGWGGRARVSDPGWPFATEFSSPGAKFFQVYSPPSGGFFAAEPVSHANTAMNAPEQDWAELGFEVLEPGAEMRLDVRIDVTAL
jgi:aldose 1-epimerase